MPEKSLEELNNFIEKFVRVSPVFKGIQERVKLLDEPAQLMILNRFYERMNGDESPKNLEKFGKKHEKYNEDSVAQAVKKGVFDDAEDTLIVLTINLLNQLIKLKKSGIAAEAMAHMAKEFSEGAHRLNAKNKASAETLNPLKIITGKVSERDIKIAEAKLELEALKEFEEKQTKKAQSDNKIVQALQNFAKEDESSAEKLIGYNKVSNPYLSKMKDSRQKAFDALSGKSTSANYKDINDFLLSISPKEAKDDQIIAYKLATKYFLKYPEKAGKDLGPFIERLKPFIPYDANTKKFRKIDTSTLDAIKIAATEAEKKIAAEVEPEAPAVSSETASLIKTESEKLYRDFIEGTNGGEPLHQKLSEKESLKSAQEAIKAKLEAEIAAAKTEKTTNQGLIKVKYEKITENQSLLDQKKKELSIENIPYTQEQMSLTDLAEKDVKELFNLQKKVKNKQKKTMGSYAKSLANHKKKFTKQQTTALSTLNSFDEFTALKACKQKNEQHLNASAPKLAEIKNIEQELTQLQSGIEKLKDDNETLDTKISSSQKELDKLNASLKETATPEEIASFESFKGAYKEAGKDTNLQNLLAQSAFIYAQTTSAYTDDIKDGLKKEYQNTQEQLFNKPSEQQGNSEIFEKNKAVLMETRACLEKKAGYSRIRRALNRSLENYVLRKETGAEYIKGLEKIRAGQKQSKLLTFLGYKTRDALVTRMKNKNDNKLKQ